MSEETKEEPLKISAKPGISRDPETNKLSAVVHMWVGREPSGDPDFVWVDEARFPLDKPNKVRRHIKKKIKPRIRQMVLDLREKISNELVRPEEDDIIFGSIRVRAAATKREDGYVPVMLIFDSVSATDSSGVQEFECNLEKGFKTAAGAFRHFDTEIVPKLPEFLEANGYVLPLDE